MVLLLFACASPPPPPAATTSPEAAAVADPGVDTREPPARETRGPKNRPPEFTAIDLTPSAPKVGETVLAVPKVADPEHQDVTFEYEWQINGAPVLDVTRERLPSGRLKKGDSVAVKVTASDGTDESVEVSPPIKVVNSPPTFKTGPRDVKTLDGFQFQAEDADDDPLTWRIEGAPAGMTISAKGRLAYQGTEDEPGGKYTVAVIVEDGEAFGRFELPLTITPGSKAKAAAEKAEKK